MTASPSEDRQPCPACATAGRDADECAGTPRCLTCRGVQHRETWGCCDGCVARVDAQLGELLELHALASLPEYLVPAWGGTGGGHGSERPLGVNVAALDLASGEHALGVLESWERWWREHWDLSPYGPASAAYAARCGRQAPRLASTPTSRTLTGVTGFLRAWWPRAALVVEPPPEEFAQEVHRLHRDALAALRLTPFDLDPDPQAKEPPDYTLPCPGCGQRIGMHRAPLDTPIGDTARVNCDRCGWHGTGEWLIRVALASGARPAMTLRQVMGHYGVTQGTIRNMVARGDLIKRGDMYTPNVTIEAG